MVTRQYQVTKSNYAQVTGLSLQKGMTITAALIEKSSVEQKQVISQLNECSAGQNKTLPLLIHLCTTEWS